MTSSVSVTKPAAPAPKPWYSFLTTHEFIGGVAIVTGWLSSLPKLTWHDALVGLGGLLGAFGVGKANATP